MKKRKNWLFAGVMLLIMLVMAGCGGKEDFEAADKVAYEYIASKVERDDDRLIALLTEEGLENAKKARLVKEGEHLYPGNEEKMENRYEIVRFEDVGAEDTLYYRVKYELPNNKLSESTTDYIEVVQNNNEWKLTKPMTISNDKLEEVFPSENDKEKGTMVHEYSES